MLKVGDKVRVINDINPSGSLTPYHWIKIGAVAKVLNVYDDNRVRVEGVSDNEARSDLKQTLLPQHYELLVETNHE